MPDDISEQRRKRLAELLQHEDFGGVKNALGNALGYTGGAYVRQMIAGERAITEKLVAKIETINGGRYKGWFTGGAETRAPAEPEDDSTHGSVSMPRDWPFKAVPPSELADLTPAEMVVVEGAVMETVLRVKSMRRSDAAAAPGAVFGNSRRA